MIFLSYINMWATAPPTTTTILVSLIIILILLRCFFRIASQKPVFQRKKSLEEEVLLLNQKDLLAVTINCCLSSVRFPAGGTCLATLPRRGRVSENKIVLGLTPQLSYQDKDLRTV